MRLFRKSCRRMDGSSLAVDQNEYDDARVSRLSHIAERRQTRRSRHDVIAGAKLNKIVKPSIVPMGDDVCVGKNPVGYAVNPEKVMLAMALQQKYNVDEYEQLQSHRNKISKVIEKELQDAMRLFPNASPNLLRQRTSSAYDPQIQSPQALTASSFALSGPLSWTESRDFRSGRPHTTSSTATRNSPSHFLLCATGSAHLRKQNSMSALDNSSLSQFDFKHTDEESALMGNIQATSSRGATAGINILYDSDPLRRTQEEEEFSSGDNRNRRPGSSDSSSSNDVIGGAPLEGPNLTSPSPLSPPRSLGSPYQGKNSPVSLSRQFLRNVHAQSQSQGISNRFDSRAVPVAAPPELPKRLRASEILCRR